MPRLTLTEKSKATTKPWTSRLLRQPARKQSGSILEYTHAYLLTCSGPTRGKAQSRRQYKYQMNKMTPRLQQSTAFVYDPDPAVCSTSGAR